MTAESDGATPDETADEAPGEAIDEAATSADHELVIHVHIGTMKTGTSFLQQVLRRNTALLEAQGVLHPRQGAAIGGAARDVLEREDDLPNPDAAWTALAERLHAWPGRAAVVSSEFLSFADARQVAEFVRPLRPAPVEIVVTVRDFARVIPSAWQNKVKHGKGWPFPNYVQAVTRHPPRPQGPARSFWHHHDVVSIAQRWGDVVGIDHVTVVTLPPSGAPPELLWERFATAIDVDPTGFDTTPDQKSNMSLGYTEAELLRLVNRRLKDTVDREQYRENVLAYFANVVLRPDLERAAARDRPLLTPEAHDWTISRGEATAESLRALGVRVVGDLADLVPRPLTAEQRDAAAAATAPTIPDPVVRAVAELLLELVAAEGTPKARRRSESSAGKRQARRARDADTAGAQP